MLRTFKYSNIINNVHRFIHNMLKLSHFIIRHLCYCQHHYCFLQLPYYVVRVHGLSSAEPLCSMLCDRVRFCRPSNWKNRSPLLLRAGQPAHPRCQRHWRISMLEGEPIPAKEWFERPHMVRRLKNCRLQAIQSLSPINNSIG